MRPLRTTVVLLTPLTVRQVVYRGTELVKATVKVFDEQGLDVACTTTVDCQLPDRILSGKASPACIDKAACEVSKLLSGAKLALLEEI